MKVAIDYDFCISNHGFADRAAVDRWFDHGPLADLRTFSPWFSPVDYVLDFADVQEAGAAPIEHYLQFGRKEQRQVRAAPTMRAFDATARPEAAVEAPRIAYTLHIFYPSHVRNFLERARALAEVPGDFFVSVSEEVARECGEAIAAALGPRLKALLTTPNIGRNFAPLLVGFADALAAYDVICHCHSKESRHSGRRQTEWADYLVAAVLAPPDVARRHIDLIASGRADAVAPAPYRGVPPWASHSLSNDDHFSRLCTLLGIDATTGFMTYPVGGMFWISGRIYRRLLELKLTLDNFPAEPSRPDGEIHHALERLIGRLAGPRLAFFDQVTGQYWSPTAVLRSELARFPRQDDLCQAVLAHEFVTFDFFDTLCTRAGGDEDWAKKRVGWTLGIDYLERRNAAEAALRAEIGPGEDVPLVAVAQRLFVDGMPDAFRAAALERRWDANTLVPRPMVTHAYELAVSEKKTVLIISDSYYDAGLIRSFLDRHGMPRPDAVLTSADVGLRKDRGDLWAHVGQLAGRKRALHIGDNVHSDIQKASSQGFTTFYVPHWRHELLPRAGLSRMLVQRNLLNPAFARSIDRQPPEPLDELPDRDVAARS